MDVVYQRCFYQGFKGLKRIIILNEKNPLKSFKSLTFSMSFIKDLKDLKDFSSNLNPFQSLKSPTIIYIIP